jgi:prepilin-type N-terminal cleavage/methylation domain-containing protein
MTMAMAKKLRSPRCRLSGAARRGFTFIEILATLVLLAIVLPAVMGGFSLCLATADFAHHQAQASFLAHGKLMELVAGEQWQKTDLSGDFGTDQPGYRWTAQVSTWDSAGLLQQIEVTVWWRQRGQDRSVVLSTLAYTGGTQ